MNDIVEWLRQTEKELYGATRCNEAADEIERLRGKLEDQERIENKYYLLGMTAGWNFGVNYDVKRFNNALVGREWK